MKNTKMKKSKTGNGKWRLIVISIIVLTVGGAYWFFSQGSDGRNYPINAAGSTFKSPTIAETTVSLPVSIVQESKLVFMDVKLENNIQQLTYKGRVIPLENYREGAYLPLVVIYTPSGKVVSGIRVCEPCGSFSFHIAEGKYLRCDLCGTEWDLETLKGVNGGCQSYPPPGVPSTIAGDVNIDLSSVGLILA